MCNISNRFLGKTLQLHTLPNLQSCLSAGASARHFMGFNLLFKTEQRTMLRIQTCGFQFWLQDLQAMRVTWSASLSNPLFAPMYNKSKNNNNFVVYNKSNNTYGLGWLRRPDGRTEAKDLLRCSGKQTQHMRGTLQFHNCQLPHTGPHPPRASPNPNLFQEDFLQAPAQKFSLLSPLGRNW